MECNAELFDFDNDKVYTKLINSFTTLYDLRTLRSALIPLSSSTPILEYYYLLGLFPINSMDIIWKVINSGCKSINLDH